MPRSTGLHEAPGPVRAASGPRPPSDKRRGLIPRHGGAGDPSGVVDYAPSGRGVVGSRASVAAIALATHPGGVRSRPPIAVGLRQTISPAISPKRTEERVTRLISSSVFLIITLAPLA